jgi:mutator protein MutT
LRIASVQNNINIQAEFILIFLILHNTFEIDMITVTCAVIKDNEGKILVAQRSQAMSLPLKWEFPGGKLEIGESVEGCLIREIKDELYIYNKI